MYRLLLVDDELDVLQYFGRILKEQVSKDLEIDVYMVDSAQKAIDYFREYKVDLVVADIQMPGTSGVEMYHQIKKIWPKSRFLFLTGFMDFEYVYSTAAQDGNTRFLTKLEPVPRIVETVETMLMELEQDYREKELVQNAAMQNQEIFPILQNRCLGQFIHGKGRLEQIREEFEKYEISLQVSEELHLIAASLDGGELQMEKLEHFKIVLKAVMMNELEKDYRLYCYLSDEEEVPFTWLLQKKAGSVRTIPDLLEYVQTVFRKNTGHTVSFAYGSTSGDYRENPQLYKRVYNALGYRRQELAENIIPCSLQKEAGNTVWSSEELLESWNRLIHIGELEHCLKLGQKMEFLNMFDEMTAHMDQVKSMNYAPAQEIYFRLAVMLLSYINLWQLNEELAFHVELYRLMRVDMHNSWEEGVEFLRKTAGMVFDLHFEEERRNVSGYVVYVRDYIRNHMGEDLSLVQLADHVSLNASYLSRLFKKETGERLYDYILGVRMQKAIELVMEGTTRIQDIARIVGYESVQSFNRAFKKYTGEAPVDYRSRECSAEVKNSEEK